VTEAQYRMWSDIAMECAGPSLPDAITPLRAVKAFPHLFEALRRERERVVQLEAVLAYIDAHAPLADATCDEPGIALSEAARRATAEVTP